VTDISTLNGSGRVTLQVIAEQLSVSTATVSLALRNSPVVADLTKQRVQQLARDLGYIYNRSAASLRTARTNILAVAVHDITNPYFAEMLATIEEAASANGKTVLLGTYTENLGRQDRVLATLREYRPDGIIMCPAAGTDRANLDHLTMAGVPIVQIAREVDAPDLDFVGSDDARGTEVAIDYLIGLGHRRIAMIGGLQSTSTGRIRHETYRRVMDQNGLFNPALIHEGAGTRETGFKGVQALLDQADAPTAALCFNDLVAFGTMLGLRQRGIDAGSDFSVIGSDDVKEAALWHPGLTTIRNRQEEMGRRATELLLRRIADPTAPARRILLEPSLVIRGTTAPLAR
jgi:LacI family transcriptional regulator